MCSTKCTKPRSRGASCLRAYGEPEARGEGPRPLRGLRRQGGAAGEAQGRYHPISSGSRPSEGPRSCDPPSGDRRRDRRHGADARRADSSRRYRRRASWRSGIGTLPFSSRASTCREVEAAQPIDLEQLDLDLVALVDDVGHLLDAGLGQARDVAEAFLAGKDLDKGAEVHDTLDDAVVDACP